MHVLYDHTISGTDFGMFGVYNGAGLIGNMPQMMHTVKLNLRDVARKIKWDNQFPLTWTIDDGGMFLVICTDNQSAQPNNMHAQWKSRFSYTDN